MMCPYCGADNPDVTWRCGSCGRTLRVPAEPAATPLADDGLGPPLDHQPGFERPTGGDPRRLPTHRLDVAIIAAATGLVLVFIGFILYAYYYERMIDPDRDFDRIRDLFDIAKYSTYARSVGEVAALVSAVLVIQAVMVGGLGAASAAARQIPLRGVLMVCIVMTVLMAVMTVVIVYFYEATPDLSESAMRMVSRMMIYLPHTADILGIGALLVVTISLRNASLDRGV